MAAVAASLLLVATGCTMSNDSAANAPAGTTTLKFWNYYTGTQLTWLQAQTKKFEKANPKIKVDLVQVVGSQQDQKLLASVATGNGPDVLINNIVVDNPTLVAGGVMKDMTSMWNSYQDKAQYPSTAAWKTNGKVYNLMSYTNLIGLYYNKDILKASGIDSPPTTLTEFQDDMAKVTAGGTYKALAESGAPTVEGAWLFAPQLLGLGVNYCNFSGKKVTTAFDRVAGWSKKGYIPLSTATWDQNTAWQQFMTGKYAFGLNGNWQLGNVKSAKFAYGTTEFPKPTDGTSTVYPGGEGIAIGAKSKHPAEAWKYIQSVFLSKDAAETSFAQTGSIPLRKDASDTQAIKTNTYVQPFLTAAQKTGTWPNNPKTADMQTSLGKAISSVISGQQSASAGAQSAIDTIKKAKASGGGTCK
ncbi:sugar ABC transporter substrate-binding protein [Frondihabitans sucicola]|uniref:sugar ABC transporter substrate-binding protein n=1 Tax=Frondihabitans sucicola TaxID=1268041 RepID=UPI002572D90D|nr:sugar ABC transporter substrate-binding protein [Frondihabitans sucicola]